MGKNKNSIRGREEIERKYGGITCFQRHPFISEASQQVLSAWNCKVLY
jgi:hypothetical protein